MKLKIKSFKMVIVPPKSELEMQEKIIGWEERIEAVPKPLFLALAATLILSVPMGVFLHFSFFRMFYAGYTPPRISLGVPAGKDLEIKGQGFFSTESGSYFAFARIFNPNTDLAVRQLNFNFILADSGGRELARYESSTSSASYILPGKERILFMPPQKLQSEPAKVRVELEFDHWSRVSLAENLNFLFEGVAYGQENNGPFTVSAQVRNDNPFVIGNLELAILLYDSNRKIVGVNVTNLNNLIPNEVRFFRVLWPMPITAKVAQVEFKPSVNVMQAGATFSNKGEIDDYFDSQR